MIECKACGGTPFTGNQIITHIREEHQLDVKSYCDKYQSSVATKEFIKRSKEIDLRLDSDNKVYEKVNLCKGVTFPAYFDVNERIPHVIEDYLLIPNLIWEITEAVKNKMNIFLIGPSGCGKSSVIMQLAARIRKPCLRFPCSGETTASKLLGRWAGKGNELHWYDGMLTKAFRNGWWIILDEIDCALPEILAILHEPLEKEGLMLEDNDDEYITMHPDTRIFFTANTLGRGDESGLYAGTQILNAAFLDRAGEWTINVDYPQEADEKMLLQKRFPTMRRGDGAKTLKNMLAVAKSVRSGISGGTLYTTFSTRKLIRWSAMFHSLNSIKASAEGAIIRSENKASADTIRELCKTEFGEEWDNSMTLEQATSQGVNTDLDQAF